MEWWQIYLLTRCESIKDHLEALSFSFIVLATLACVVCIPYCDLNKVSFIDAFKTFKIKWMVIVVLVASSISVFVPSNKDIAIIISGHWATHSEEMKKLPDNVLSTLNSLLDKAQEKLK